MSFNRITKILYFRTAQDYFFQSWKGRMIHLGPVLQRVAIDPNQSQVCSLLSLMYILAIYINNLRLISTLCTIWGLALKWNCKSTISCRLTITKKHYRMATFVTALPLVSAIECIDPHATCATWHDDKLFKNLLGIKQRN